MDINLRKTGIDVVGDVPWGTHLCQFYANSEDLADILVPYFKEGLENNEFCMWITSEPLDAEGARRALRRAVSNLDEYVDSGQIEILDAGQWYTKEGTFDAERVLQDWVDKETFAIEKGFEGLRLSGNTFWLEDADWGDFAAYETEIDRIIEDHSMLAICSYSLERCGAPEIIDVVDNHESAIIRKEGEWHVVESAKRKAAQRGLRESEERHRALFETMTQGVIYHDAEGAVIAINPAAERIMGPEARKWRLSDPERPGWKMVREDGSAFARDEHPIRVALNEGKEAKDVVIGMRGPDGSVRLWFRTSIFPLFRSGEDKPFQVYSVSEDITERRRVEEELANHRARLEELVEERARELKDVQESLVRQERLAVLGQMAGGVGHELRNPLGAIKNVAYYLKMALKQPEPRVAESLDQMDRAVTRADGIISSLLDFAGQRPPTLLSGNVNDVVREALSQVEAPENVEVATRLDDTLPWISLDPGQLGRAFANIALNAFQAMPRGGRLTVKSERSGAEWTTISFSDTGAGLPPEDLAKVFQPLFTTRARGIGLGLAISKTMVEAHGGSIEAQSKPGAGSTFTVRLPVGSEEEKEV